MAYCAREGIAPIAIHASYLINLAGSAQPFARQSLEGLTYEMQRAPAYGASLVNTHIGSHRGDGKTRGIVRLATNVLAVLADSPATEREIHRAVASGDTGAIDWLCQYRHSITPMAAAATRLTSRSRRSTLRGTVAR